MSSSLITFLFLPFQVQVGSTPQDQRIVGYISCTHLQAIAGTVLRFIFVCHYSRPGGNFVHKSNSAKKGRQVSPALHISSLRVIIMGHRQKLSLGSFSLLPLNQILVS